MKDETKERLEKQVTNGEGGELAPLEEAQDMADLEEPGDMVYGVPEARAPKLLQEPHLPHPKEVAEHNVTHCPYRSWCNICVEAAGREDAHKKGARDVAGDDVIPTIGFDYNYFGDHGLQIDEDKFESGRDVVAMVIKDFRSGTIWAHSVKCKGPKDAWLMRRMVLDIETSGQSHIRLKSDGEPAAKAVQKYITLSGADLPRGEHYREPACL